MLACLAGEVPDLLGADDLEEIGNALRPSMAAAGLPVTKMSIYSYFVSRCVWAAAGLRECQTGQRVHLLPNNALPASFNSLWSPHWAGANTGPVLTSPLCPLLWCCRVRSCLHMVLCFSPVGDAFRQRLRMFPSLVNCTTIDWFNNWPLEALRSVARSFCADLELEQDADGTAPAAANTADMLEGVLAACVHIHQSVEATSKRYYEELRR